MDIEKMDEKIAEHVRKVAELELEKQKRRKAKKEAIESDKRKADVMLQTQIDHDNYLKEEQRKRDQIEYEKSDRGRTERAKREAYGNIQRDREAGLTEEEIRVKYLDSKARIKEFNKRGIEKTEAKLKKANSFLSDMYKIKKD